MVKQWPVFFYHLVMGVTSLCMCLSVQADESKALKLIGSRVVDMNGHLVQMGMDNDRLLVLSMGQSLRDWITRLLMDGSGRYSKSRV